MQEGFIHLLFLYYSGFYRYAFTIDITLPLHFCEYLMFQVLPLCSLHPGICFPDQPASECLVGTIVHIRGAALSVTSINY